MLRNLGFLTFYWWRYWYYWWRYWYMVDWKNDGPRKPISSLRCEYAWLSRTGGSRFSI